MEQRRVSALYIRALFFLAFGFLAAPVRAELPQYQTRDLGTLGGEKAEVAATNSRGWIVGWSHTFAGGEHAFVYRDGDLEDLGTLGGDQSWAADINYAGQVVGTAQNAAGDERAFLYRDGEMLDLGTLGGATSYATAVNATGQVVGTADTADGSAHAFLYSNGQMIDLGTLGGPMSSATALNDSGQVTGWASLPGGSVHAFLYTHGRMIDLGTLGGASSYGVDISELGDVTGDSTIASTWMTHAFLYSSGTMTDIGLNPPSDMHQSMAAAINDSGVVAGTFHDFGFFSRGCEDSCTAFTYDHGARTYVGGAGAMDISNTGMVTGANGGDWWHDTRTFIYRPGKATVALPAFDWLTAIDRFVQGNMGIAVNDAGLVAGNAWTHGSLEMRARRGYLATPITLLFDRLTGEARAAAPTHKLTKILSLARAYYDGDNLVGTCSQLVYFDSRVRKLPPKKTPQAQKNRLIDQSVTIRDAIDCP